MKETQLWNFVRTNLQDNNNVVLMIVVNHEEGSPGKEGFKMAVSSAGGIYGSIGGGIMEHNIVEKAKESLKAGEKLSQIEKLYHKRKVSSKKSGLICSGSQTNYTLTLTKNDLPLIEKISDAAAYYRKATLTAGPQGLRLKEGVERQEPFYYNFKSENDWHYEESAGYKNIAYVIGGGHVGLQVCKVLSMLDFYVAVYDHRTDIPTLAENEYVQRVIIDDYNNLGSYLKDTPNPFVIIVTTNYMSDKAAVMQAVQYDCRYIGMMGTMVKIKKIINEAVKEGTSKKLLEQVYAPIGVDINSDTPEEIAISIAAEVVWVKNGNL